MLWSGILWSTDGDINCRLEVNHDPYRSCEQFSERSDSTVQSHLYCILLTNSVFSASDFSKHHLAGVSLQTLA